VEGCAELLLQYTQEAGEDAVANAFEGLSVKSSMPPQRWKNRGRKTAESYRSLDVDQLSKRTVPRPVKWRESMLEKGFEFNEEIERYITPIVKAICEPARKRHVNNGIEPILYMDVVLVALVRVQACVIAHTNSLSGTPEALKESVEGCAELLLQYTKEAREDAVANAFSDFSVKSNMPPHATPQ
jgi:hypothetical protein